VEAKRRLEALVEEGVEARIEDGRLRIRVEAVVDGVAVEREYTFTRDKDSTTYGRVSTQADAPGGREEDIKRLKALATVIFGETGTPIGGRELLYTKRHLEHAMKYSEVKEAAERWLREGEGGHVT